MENFHQAALANGERPSPRPHRSSRVASPDPRDRPTVVLFSLDQRDRHAGAVPLQCRRAGVGNGRRSATPRVRPEWEDPANRGGSTLSARYIFAKRRVAFDVWEKLVLDCTRGACPDAVIGVVCCRKFAKSLKLEVWLSSSADVVSCSAWVNEVTGDQSSFSISSRS